MSRGAGKQAVSYNERADDFINEQSAKTEIGDDQERHDTISSMPNDATHDDNYLANIFGPASTLKGNNPLMGHIKQGKATLDRHIDFLRYAKAHTIEELAQGYLDGNPKASEDLEKVRRRMSNRIDGAKKAILEARGKRFPRSKLTAAFDKAKAAFGVEKRKNKKAGERRLVRKGGVQGSPGTPLTPARPAGGEMTEVDMSTSLKTEEETEADTANTGGVAGDQDDESKVEASGGEEDVAKDDWVKVGANITDDSVFGVNGAARALMHFSRNRSRIGASIPCE